MSAHEQLDEAVHDSRKQRDALWWARNKFQKHGEVQLINESHQMGARMDDGRLDVYAEGKTWGEAIDRFIARWKEET